MEEYLVPSGEGIDEHTEKRSRFIGHIWRTDTEEEALAAIKATRESMWDARHHVYAYIIRGGAMRYSDDGEPQGTGGMPVLDVLRRQELQNVCCVVTRYFGGTLLGPGGLVRAYTAATQAAVAAAEAEGLMVTMTQVTRVTCVIPYSAYGRVERLVSDCSGKIRDSIFAEDVQLTCAFLSGDEQRFVASMVELMGGEDVCLVSEPTFSEF